jgi:hypothetical protein
LFRLIVFFSKLLFHVFKFHITSYESLTNLFQASYKQLVNFLWISHKIFRSFIQTSNDLFYNLLASFLRSSSDCLMNFVYNYYKEKKLIISFFTWFNWFLKNLLDLHLTFLQTYRKFVKTPYTFLWISFKLLMNFLQSCCKIL